MNLDNNAHSVFLLQYHLVLVVKYRRQVFDDGISSRAKEIFEYIAPNYNITLEEWNYDKDHIHILFRAHPNTCLLYTSSTENAEQYDFSATCEGEFWYPVDSKCFRVDSHIDSKTICYNRRKYAGN